MKVLVTAAMVVGAVALVATGVGAIAPAIASSAWAAGASATAMTISSIGAVASQVATFGAIAAAGLGVAAQLLARTPKPPPTPFAWKADPQAGIPYAMGQCYVGGQIVYRMAYGSKNKYQTLVTVMSGAGPHESIDTLYVDNVARSWEQGGEVNIPDEGFMYARAQLGATPEASNLLCAPVDPFAWTADCKLSGYAATIVTLKWDTKGDHTMTTTPAVGWFGKWAKIYDPRKDSTYTGGAGSHRSDDESTWEWSENPYLHALTWLIGRRANGKLVLGVGVDLANVLVDQFVEGANVADANGWKLAGVAYSTDDKWDVLKRILQAGGGQPLRLGGQLGCIVQTPRVSLATITAADLAGEASVQATQARKDRINAVVPRYLGKQSVTTEDSDDNLVTSDTFDILAGAPIIVEDYVTLDGKVRQKEIEYSYVPGYDGDPVQAAQLAAYDIVDAREFGPISLPLKLRWYGYRPGDVVTVDIEELGLSGQDILLLNRSLSPQDGTVTMTARSETSSKHAFALSQSTTAPETPGVSIPDLSVSAPQAGDWTLTGTTISSAGGSTPALLVALAAGHEVDDTVDTVIFELREHVDGQADDAGWGNADLSASTVTTKTINTVAGGVEYDVAVSYRSGSSTSGRLILGPATPGALSAGDALQMAVLNSFILEAPVITAAADGTVTIVNHTRRYPDGHADVAVTGATLSTGLTAGESRSVAYDDPGRLGGAVTYDLYEDDNDAHASVANPGRHYVGYFAIPSSGSAGGGGGGVGGGRCVTDDTPIRMASYDRQGPGLEKVAADIKVGDWVWTQHEITMQLGAWQVTAIEFADEQVYRADGYPRATAAHLFWKDGGWVRMDAIGIADGTARIAKITVDDAHTYISAGVLSHNIKAIP